jgi:hypothetical protein
VNRAGPAGLPFLVAPLVVALALCGASTVAAGPVPEPARQAEVPVTPDQDPPPGLGLSAAVEALPLVSDELDAARSELASVLRQREVDIRRVDEILPEIAALVTETRSLGGLVARRDERIAKLADSRVASRAALSGVAVEWFITGFGALEGLDPTLTTEERDRLAHQYVLSEVGAHAAL